MPRLNLLTLRLHAPLPFLGLENPPIGASALLAPPEDLVEGMEELFVFAEEGLVHFDPDDGPRLILPLALPRFHGHGGRAMKSQGSPWAIPPGSYLFMQFRPRDEAEFLEGLEWFAREAWWGGERMQGPWLIRRLREDGGLATQVLRSLAPGA